MRRRRRPTGRPSPPAAAVGPSRGRSRRFCAALLTDGSLMSTPVFPPSRALLGLIQRKGPFTLTELYAKASVLLPPGTFRSKTHYKDCLKGLRRRKQVGTLPKRRPREKIPAIMMEVKINSGISLILT